MFFYISYSEPVSSTNKIIRNFAEGTRRLLLHPNIMQNYFGGHLIETSFVWTTVVTGSDSLANLLTASDRRFAIYWLCYEEPSPDLENP